LFCEGPLSDIPENIDYDFAQQELMLQQMEDDPIQVAIRSIEKQHEEDKQGKLFLMSSTIFVLFHGHYSKSFT